MKHPVGYKTLGYFGHFRKAFMVFLRIELIVRGLRIPKCPKSLFECWSFVTLTDHCAVIIFVLKQSYFQIKVIFSVKIWRHPEHYH